MFCIFINYLKRQVFVKSELKHLSLNV